MSTSYYSIQIYCNTDDYLEINKILGVKSTDLEPSEIWSYEVTVGEDDKYYDFISEFMDILQGNYEKLEKLGIKRSVISLWLIYEYDEQCNMEFDPMNLKRMGENGIGLCISCY